MQNNDISNPIDSDGQSNEDDEVIELTHIVTGPSGISTQKGLTPETDMATDLSGFGEDTAGLEKLVADVVENLEPNAPNPGDRPPASVSIPLKQMETAVEKAVRKMFSNKIEAMVIDIIENVVKKEIEKINALIKELADHKK